jgi:hypothetical protein
MRSNSRKFLVAIVAVSVLLVSSCAKESSINVVEPDKPVDETVISDEDLDFKNLCNLAQKYSFSNHELADYYYLNALNKHPENSELWMGYVSNAMEYCNEDGLSTVYSNLDLAIISVDSEHIEKMIELQENVLNKIIEFSLESSAENEQVSSEPFLLSCDEVVLMFDDAASSLELISSRYADITNDYYALEESSEADLAFSLVSGLCQLIESIGELQAYAGFLQTADYGFSDAMNAIGLLDSSKLSIQYAYAAINGNYTLINSELEKLCNLCDDVEMHVLALMKNEVESRQPVFEGDSAKYIEELTDFQLFLQEMLQLIGNHVSLYDFLNEEMTWLGVESESIALKRQKDYQRWAYSVLVDARNLETKKASYSDYIEYITIDSSLLIPELQVIYGDLHDTLSKKLEDYDSLVQYAVENGLRTLEDF